MAMFQRLFPTPDTHVSFADLLRFAKDRNEDDEERLFAACKLFEAIDNSNIPENDKNKIKNGIKAEISDAVNRINARPIDPEPSAPYLGA